MFRQKQQHPAQCKKTRSYACGSPHKSEQQVFGPKLALNLPGRCAQRQPSGDLTRAAQHTHQGQPGEVCASNEQNESRCQHQGQHLRAEPIRFAFLQGHTVIRQLRARIGLGEMVGAEAPSQRSIGLGICLLPGRAVAQPHDCFKVSCPALALAARLERRIQIGI